MPKKVVRFPSVVPVATPPSPSPADESPRPGRLDLVPWPTCCPVLLAALISLLLISSRSCAIVGVDRAVVCPLFAGRCCVAGRTFGVFRIEASSAVSDSVGSALKIASGSAGVSVSNGREAAAADEVARNGAFKAAADSASPSIVVSISRLPPVLSDAPASPVENEAEKKRPSGKLPRPNGREPPNANATASNAA